MYAQPTGTHLTQINVATAKYDLTSEAMANFVAMLKVVNDLAEVSPGFVWRLKDEDGAGATGVRVDDNPRTIVQLSVWASPEALENFVWKTVHAKVYNRKQEWFGHDAQPNLAFGGSQPGSPQQWRKRLRVCKDFAPTVHLWRRLVGRSSRARICGG